VWALDPDYDVAPYSVQWSADGSALLFAARRSANLWRREARLYRLTLKTQRLEPVSPDDLRVGYDMDPIREPLQAVWVGRDIVICARRADDSSVADGDGGKALYVWRKGRLRTLPLPPGSMPFAIVATSTHSVFILRANSLWKIPVSGAAPTDLTADIPGGVRPAWDVSAGYRLKQWTYVPPSRYVALETLHDSQPKLIVVDVASGRRQVMRRPSARAKLIALSHAGNAALMTDAAPFDALYLAAADGSLRSLRSYNPHLAQVDPSVVRKIAFNGRHGEKLHAWLVLPPDYRPGRKYPVIVEVYGDSLRGESATLGVDVHDRTFNPHVFAAFGYACLLPSMPLEPMGRGSDPAIGISHDVLAALDAAVADGAIDASRPALYGHSYGMFTGLGVLMETERFRVAGLISGFSDLASEFGSIMPSFTVFAPENLQRAFMEHGWAEGGQGRMGVPPWEDPARYVRNSGYFNAQRIRTPLFLAHGDLDGITMTHSEKMFSALLRLQRDAKFVRYWGEGHNFSSPANIRDLWQQLLAWYDEWLGLVRDDQGRLIFEGNVVKSRGDSAALTPADFTSFDSRK
jgi:dipeptidyl aminopeptidase/acylaminoacyl peptidase